jgi:hypothetical protein
LGVESAWSLYGTHSWFASALAQLYEVSVPVTGFSYCGTGSGAI